MSANNGLTWDQVKSIPLTWAYITQGQMTWDDITSFRSLLDHDVTITANQNTFVPIYAKGLQYADRSLTVEYDTAKLELLNAAYQHQYRFRGDNFVKIVSQTPGKLVLHYSKTNPSYWAGLVTQLLFRAKITGNTSVRLIY